MDVEHLEETEQDRDSFDGPKHWHYYEIIARQRDEAGHWSWHSPGLGLI